MPSTPLAVRDAVDPAAARPVAYQALVLATMLVVLGLATFLPGTGRTLPGTEVTIYELVVATGTVAVVLWLARAAPAVAALVEAAIEGPEPVVADLGRAASALVVFLAVLVAYRGLAGLVVPVLAAERVGWSYDLAFLALGLVPLAVIANRLRRNLDVVADQVAAGLAGREEPEVGPDDRTDV